MQRLSSILPIPQVPPDKPKTKKVTFKMSTPSSDSISKVPLMINQVKTTKKLQEIISGKSEITRDAKETIQKAKELRHIEK